MADAGTAGEARHLRQRVSRTDAAGRGPICSLCGLERSAVLGGCPAGGRGVRAVFRSVWTLRPAGSDDHSDRPQARLLLPVAVRAALATSALARDSGSADWAGGGDSRIAASSLSGGRRREKLE